MPHVRKRHLTDRFEKLCRFSPLVGVFGHRQSGKTTFVESSAKRYLTFDRERDLSEAQQDPEAFISRNHSIRTVIDECQLAPKIFPALKEWVRTHKKPGQFVLTGSVRFTSRKAIRESLTGRIVSSEMLPMNVSEILERPLSHSLIRLLECKDFNRHDLSSLHARHFAPHLSSFKKYLSTGGLPGICFVRDSGTRSDYLRTLIDLILDRDLRQVAVTSLSLEALRRYLTWIAQNALKPYSYAAVKRSLGLAEQTQKKLLNAFESIYLIRRLKRYGSKGEIVLLEDQLEELLLSEKALSVHDQAITAFYRNARTQFIYRSETQCEFFQYQTRGGAYVPLGLKTDLGVLGFIFVRGAGLELSEKRSAESFLRAFPGAKMLFLTLEPGPAEVLNVDMLKLTVSTLL